MKKFLLPLALFTLLMTSSAQAASRVEFILDVSGSMNKLTGGEKRIELARKAMASAVASIPDGSIVALRLYSHRIAPSDKAASCKDTELVVPFGPINKQQIVTIVNGANPLGETPIAYSLEQAANDFPATGDEQAVIILVSDGEESCGGDPVAVAKALLAKGFKVTIHTIGLDVDANARAQLGAISTATGGQYKDARDAAGLTQSLQQLTQESLLVKKEISTYGTPIRGGNSYETAVALTPGTQYHLDHHQRKNEFDFFYVDVKDGQKLDALLETGVKGVTITGEPLNEKVQENNSPYAGLQIHSPQRQRLVNEEIIGDVSNRKLITVPVGAGQGGRFYVLIGSTYDNQHKDNPFTVSLIDTYDAGTTMDAGDTAAQAIPIQPGSYPKNYLSPNDKVDMYKFTAAPGATYSIKARASNEKKRLHIAIIDADGVQLADGASPNEGAAVKIDSFGSVKGGELFIKLSSYYSDEIESDYNMELAAAAAPADAPPTTVAAAPTAPTAPSSAPPSGATEGKPMPVPSDSTTQATSPGTLKDSKEVCLLIKTLPWMQKAKFYGIYVGIPLVAGWLIGMIWGYIKGRKAGRRKALKQNPPKA